MVQRVRFCTDLYGWRHGALSIPRVLVSNLINSTACVRAIHEYLNRKNRNTGAPMQWDKTDHRFPDLGAA
jgi:adsorption protein B